MKIDKSLRVIFPRELDDAFLTKMQQLNLNPQHEWQKQVNLNAENDSDEKRNSIVKQRLYEEEVC